MYQRCFDSLNRIYSHFCPLFKDLNRLVKHDISWSSLIISALLSYICWHVQQPTWEFRLCWACGTVACLSRLRGPGLPLSCVQMALHQPEGSISERRESRWPVCCPLIPVPLQNVLNCWQVRNRHLQSMFLFCFVFFSCSRKLRKQHYSKSRKASNLSNCLTFYYLKKIKINHKSQRYSHCVTMQKDRPARLAIS